jgi:methyl-accepting chemotaxis protein
MRQWTFSRKIAVGFALSVALTVLIGVVATLALEAAVRSKDRVIDADSQIQIDAQALRAARLHKSTAIREFLLTREDRALREIAEARAEFARRIDSLQRLSDDDSRDLIRQIQRLEAEQQTELEQVLALRRTDAPLEASIRNLEQMNPIRDRLDTTLDQLTARGRERLRAATQASSDAASRAQAIVIAIAVIAAGLAAAIAFALSRSLNRQVGTAVAQVQTSSAELQAAATQQATSSTEQATAMSEISTTISELLATSRQITGSAQRVAQIAGQTSGAAKAGEAIVDTAHASIGSIRRQVDLIVGHMLELGRKSQQIGGVLDIVAELAEQTNILAINATIEAAGAGEGGRRFGVVADEIRKLADRVAGSAKEIRGLIDDVRSAVNTTVMVTETGSKAVDAGAAQFTQVAASFRQIVDLVGTTTEAGREIELSTKQQATAVEQVNVAIANVAQASRETEASSGQTQQTASQLVGLSRDLMRLVRPQTV